MPSTVWGDDRLYLKFPEFVCYVPRPPDVAMVFIFAQHADVLGVEQVIELGILGPPRIGEKEGCQKVESCVARFVLRDILRNEDECIVARYRITSRVTSLPADNSTRTGSVGEPRSAADFLAAVILLWYSLLRNFRGRVEFPHRR